MQQRTKLTPLAETYEQYVGYSQLLAEATTTEAALPAEEVAELRAKVDQVYSEGDNLVDDPSP